MKGTPGVLRPRLLQLGRAPVDARPPVAGKLRQVPPLPAAGVQPIAQWLQQPAQQRHVASQFRLPQWVIDVEGRIRPNIALAVDLTRQDGIVVRYRSAQLITSMRPRRPSSGAVEFALAKAIMPGPARNHNRSRLKRRKITVISYARGKVRGWYSLAHAKRDGVIRRVIHDDCH